MNNLKSNKIKNQTLHCGFQFNSIINNEKQRVNLHKYTIRQMRHTLSYLPIESEPRSSHLKTCEYNGTSYHINVSCENQILNRYFISFHLHRSDATSHIWIKLDPALLVSYKNTVVYKESVNFLL